MAHSPLEPDVRSGAHGSETDDIEAPAESDLPQASPDVARSRGGRTQSRGSPRSPADANDSGGVGKQLFCAFKILSSRIDHSSALLEPFRVRRALDRDVAGAPLGSNGDWSSDLRHQSHQCSDRCLGLTRVALKASVHCIDGSESSLAAGRRLQRLRGARQRVAVECSTHSKWLKQSRT